MNEFQKEGPVSWQGARRRRSPRDRRLWWLALYPLAWILLFAASSSYWFLPAGLRLALLWRLPKAWWLRMALLEWIGILGLSLWRDVFHSPLLLIASTVLPWTLYATTVALAGPRDHGATTLGGMIPRLLACGAIAACANALLLMAVEWANLGMLAHPGQTLFGYAMGDFVGVMIVAPVLLALSQQAWRWQPLWRELLGRGAVLLPAATALLVLLLPVPQPLVYGLVLGLFPLFWVAFQLGWRSAAVALAVLAAVAHNMEGLLQVWRPEQLQLLVAASGTAGLLLGASTDGLRTQGKALALSLQHLRKRGQELREVANRLTSVQEEERRYLGVELHDVLGQDLTAIATRLRVVELTTRDPQLHAGLHSINELVKQAHHHLREIIEHMYPAVLDRFGLQRALSEGPLAQLARDSGMEYRCEVRGDLTQLSNAASTALYRICQEVTSNCARHPDCKLLHITFAIESPPSPLRPRLTLSIHDDVGPLQADASKTGVGLQNIRDRANALGAYYRFDLADGRPRHWLTLTLGAT